MADKKKGPFRADHVGSLPRPDYVLDARDDKAAGKITPAELRKIEDRAIADVAKAQENLGLNSITDGEYRRFLWHLDFLSSFDNVAEKPGRFLLGVDKTEDISKGFRPNCMATTGKFTRSKPIQLEDFKYLKQQTSQTAKVCVPSPTLMHFRGGRDAVDAKAYPNLDQFYADVATAYNQEFQDLAKAGCKYIQIDDTNFTYLCDPKIRNSVKEMGEDPDELTDTYIKLVNDSIKGLPDDVTVAFHMCRGNFGKLASGSYDHIADKLFNGLKVDGYLLEYDDERSGGFEPLRMMPRDKRVMLGLLTTKSPVLESKDMLKTRIDEASKFLPLENLALGAQCGFGTGAIRVARTDGPRHFCTWDETQAKLSHIVQTAREVWGEV
jgi:5-methyltetrahydropteroyltriglutamate--homocysteine methyltransferase